MEDGISLDSSKQKKFVRSIKGIKKLIKKNDTKPKESDSTEAANDDKKIKKRRGKDKGLVYLSHIPHGFYENEMTQYFKQFGCVTNVRVIRSKRTGSSKGCAFIEFKEPAVGQIVAETMNNYLMGKRLLKAVYIPPEEQKPHAMRKRWSATNNPGYNLRLKMKKDYNKNKHDKGHLKRAKKILSNLRKTKQKLQEYGINYDFFQPVDVPDELAHSLEIKQENDEAVKKIKNTKKEGTKDKETDLKPEKQSNVKSKDSKNNKAKTEKVEAVVNTNLQKEKKKKHKDSNMKLPESFIKLQQSSDEESESPYEFDSDEYEKMLNDEDSSDGGDGDSDDAQSDDENDDDDDDESEEEEPQLPKLMKQAKSKSNKPRNQKKQQQQETKKNVSKVTKRKPQTQKSSSSSPKKPKFEKQTTKNVPRSKQFKKKK